MKKVLLAVLAAFVMNLGMVSCSSTPADKKLGAMEEALSIVKSTHIKSAEDVKALVEKIKPLKEKAISANTELMNLNRSKSPEELSEINEEMAEMGKQIDQMAVEMNKEGERLEKEAQEAGIDLSAFDELELF
jgi:uncharacterized coiled-coil protein SlyX